MKDVIDRNVCQNHLSVVENPLYMSGVSGKVDGGASQELSVPVAAVRGSCSWDGAASQPGHTGRHGGNGDSLDFRCS